jgi:hypothetical protein
MTRARTLRSAALTVTALPAPCRFLIRPPLLTCHTPLPVGRDISPTQDQ